MKILDISPEFKDPNYDLKDAEHRETRTAELYRFCIGREFTIIDLERDRCVVLYATEDREVKRKFGGCHSISMEPEFLVRVDQKKTSKKKNS